MNKEMQHYYFDIILAKFDDRTKYTFFFLFLIFFLNLILVDINLYCSHNNLEM